MDEDEPTEDGEAPRHKSVQGNKINDQEIFKRVQGVNKIAHERFRKSRIAVVGAGAAASNLLVPLLVNGPALVRFTDPDTVSWSNLSRQFFHSSMVGQPKAFSLLEIITPFIRTDTRVEAFNEPVEFLEDFFLDIDMIICLVDNDYTKLHVSAEARLRGIPVFFGGVDSSAEICEVFYQAGGSGPCWKCYKPDVNITMTCDLIKSPSAIHIHNILVGLIIETIMALFSGKKVPMVRRIDLGSNAISVVDNILQKAGCTVCSIPAVQAAASALPEPPRLEAVEGHAKPTTPKRAKTRARPSEDETELAMSKRRPRSVKDTV